VVSLILCLLVLLAAGYIWLHKSARGYLDRISFRLSLWAMVAQILQDVVYITLYAPVRTRPAALAEVSLADRRPALLTLRHRDVAPASSFAWRCSACECSVSRRCNYADYSVNYLFTCVAINLMLTIVFGINPVQLRESHPPRAGTCT